MVKINVALHGNMQEQILEFLDYKARKIREHSLKITTKAGSGHPTSSLSCADILDVLYFKSMSYDPGNPDNPNNDKFILSKGHAAPALYATLAEAGLVKVDDIYTLRELSSPFQGHPDVSVPWVKANAGALGQGLSIAAGFALSSKLDNLDSRVYCLLGDGEFAEGQVKEAIRFAAHNNLNNLVAIVDSNKLGQSNWTEKNLKIDYLTEFTSSGWEGREIDGHNFKELIGAFCVANIRSRATNKPYAIIANTIKGKGVPWLENKEGWHGKPVPKDRLDDAVKAVWKGYPGKIYDSHPSPKTRKTISLPPKRNSFSIPNPDYKKPIATREAVADALAELVRVNDKIIVLDADVKNSTYTDKVEKIAPDRFIELGINEQNMIGTATGLAKAGWIATAATFGQFMMLTYLQILMAYQSKANLKLFMTHAGVSIGEDGASQMDLTSIAALRGLPDIVYVQPADGISAQKLTVEILKHHGLAAIRTYRGAREIIYKPDEKFPLGELKVLRDQSSDELTIIASGYTVHEALKANELLKAEGINTRVIDLYSIKPFPTESLLKNIKQTKHKIITVEDHFAGGIGSIVADELSPYGATIHQLYVKQDPQSGRPEELMKHYKIDSAAIVEKVKEIS